MAVPGFGTSEVTFMQPSFEALDTSSNVENSRACHLLTMLNGQDWTTGCKPRTVCVL
jgi:hypothetical protein